jgi:hypothetical protein
MTQALVPEIVESNYDKAINLAIETKADLPTIEKFMDLRERWEKNEARKAYNEAMTKFKANPPDIDKNRHVSYTTNSGKKTEYNHADLFNVTDKISSELSKYGLSASWTTAQADKTISVTCKISHVQGHFESTTLSSSPDDSGGKNSIQAIGSAVTYLQRYTLLALTGLATREQDNDGQSQVEYISDKQKSTILDFINAKEIDETKFCEFMGVDSVDKILASYYNKAIAALKSAKGKK